MPALDLYVDTVRLGVSAPTGDYRIAPTTRGVGRIPLRQLSCALRVPPIPGAKRAIIDTGAPLSLFPHHTWANEFRWREGRDFDVLPVAGDPPLTGRVLSHRYAFRLARLRVPITLAGRDLAGPRLQVDSLVTQLAEPGGPAFILLGLWGGVLDGRRLLFDAAADGGITAAVAWD